MKRVWRKVIALILVLLMVLQMLPDSGFRSSLAANTNTATEVAGTPENSTSTKGTKEQTKDDSKTETEASSETELATSEAKTTEAASTETEKTKQEASDETTEQKETGTTQAEEKTTAVSEEQTTAASEEQTTTSSSEETSANTTETEPADSSEEKVDEEEKTEQKEETPKTSFTYEDNRVVITAEAGENAAFPQDTELCADYMKPDSDAYNNAVAAVEAQLAGELKADKKNVTTDYVFYDIYFLVDGERIEPVEGKVKVTMDFKSPVLGETDGEVINTDVVHVDNNGEAEIVTDKVESNKNGKVTSASFKQSSFSPVGIVRTARNSEPPEEAYSSVTLNEIDENGIGGEVTSYTIEIKIGETTYDLATEEGRTALEAWVENGNIVPTGTSISVNVNFEMGKNTYLTENSEIIYNLPNGIIPQINGFQDVPMTEMYNNVETTVGFFSVMTDDTGNKVVIRPNNNYLAEHEWQITEGTFSFNGSFDGDWLNSGKNITFEGKVPVTLINKWFVADKAEVKIQKKETEINYDEGTIAYKITVTTPDTNTVVVPSVSVKDNFTVGEENETPPSWLTYEKGSFQPSEGSIIWDNDQWTWKIGEVGIGKTLTLTYNLKLTKGHDFYESDLGGEITNTATVYSDTDQKDESTVETELGESLHIVKEACKQENGQTFYYDKNEKLLVDYSITVSAPKDDKEQWVNTGIVPDVEVVDIFTKGTDDIEGYYDIGNTSFKVNNTPITVIQKGISEPESGSYVVYDSTNKTFTWHIGDVGPQDSFTLTYTIEINNKLFAIEGEKGKTVSSAEFVNEAVLKIKDKDSGKDSATAKLEKGWIQKDAGTYNSETKAVDFRIVVNNGMPYGDGYAIKEIVDTLVGDFRYGNQIKIECLYHGEENNPFNEDIILTLGTGNNADVQVNDITPVGSTLKQQRWEINDSIPTMSQYLSGHYKLIITYSVYSEKDGVFPTAGNSAVVGIDGEAGDHHTGWIGDGQGKAVVTKTYLKNVKNRTPKWESKIPVNVYNGTIYRDVVAEADRSKMWITQEQLNAIQVTSKNDVFEDGSALEENYEIKGLSVNGSAPYYGFEITFTKDTQKVSEDNQLVITYQTEIDTTGISFGEKGDYTNECSFILSNDLQYSTSAKCTYEESDGISKTAGEFIKNGNDAGTMTWYIGLNEDKKMFGAPTITENIPDGLTFERIVLVNENNEEIESSSMSKQGDKCTVDSIDIELEEVNYNTTKKTKDKIVISINDLPRDKSLKFKVITKTTDDTWNSLIKEDEGTSTFTNKAVLNYDGKDDEETASISINNTKVTKSLNSSTDLWPDAEYGVVLNEQGLDLGTGTNKMTFTDSMKVISVTDEEGKPVSGYKVWDEDNNQYTEGRPAAEILEDTIVVKYDGKVVSAGQNVSDETYVLNSDTITDNYFELEVVDDKKVEIAYRVHFNVAAGWTVKIENTARYNGTYSSEDQTDSSIVVKDAKGALAGRVGIYLKKIDAENGKPLSNAKFKLEKVTGYNSQTKTVTTTQVASTETGGLFSSNDKGIVTFAYLDKTSDDNETILYRYTEVDSPEGYQDNATEYYFAFNDNFSEEVLKFIADKELKIAEIVTAGGNTFTVENNRIYGNIEVTKKLSTYVKENFNEVIDLVADGNKTIYVGLFTDKNGRKPYNTTPYGDPYTYKKEITIKDGESTGSVIYEDLPIGTYYVFELDSTGDPIDSGNTVGTDPDYPYLCTVTVDASESTQSGVEGSQSNGPLEIVTHYEDYDGTIPNRVTIENMYYDLPGGYSYEASILINKTLLNGSETYDTSDTFYAAVFEKTASTGGEGTTAPGQGGSTGDTGEGNNSGTSQGNTFEMAGETYRPVSKVLTLKNNDTYEIGVPLGGTNGDEPITYYVFETDADGNPIISIDAEGKITYNQPFAYDITLESTGEDGENNRGEVRVEATGEEAHPTVTITNQATSVTIEKRDTDGNPLSGATLELWKEADSPDVGVPEDEGRTKAANGDVLLETWVTDGTPHVLTAELAVGGKYYLRETGVPSGYLQAADMLFTVEDAEPITIVMEDRNASYANGRIQVTKRLSTIDQEMFEYVDLIAKDTTFYVGLFTDAAAEHPYGTDYIKEIHVQDASSQTITYNNLPSGTYYVFEVEKDGTVIPYREAQSTTVDGSGGFYCNGDGSDGEVKTITIDLDKENREGSTELNNVYYGDLPDGFAYQGELSITKSIIKDGAPAESSDVFYAGIFTSETETTPYKVVTLENNGTVTVEVPLGGENGMDPITYYIYETDANGNKLDKNAFAYDVSGEGTVALDKNNTSGTLTIVNTIPTSSETTRTITEKKDKSSGSDSSGTNRRTSSSKTGDDSRTGLWLLFFTVAAAGIVITLRRRGRHSR